MTGTMKSTSTSANEELRVGKLDETSRSCSLACWMKFEQLRWTVEVLPVRDGHA